MRRDDHARWGAWAAPRRRPPTSADVPQIETLFLETPSPVTPTGARGVGELGINGLAAAIANAVADAVGQAVAPPAQIPMTAERIRSLSHPTEGGTQ
jgi:CO/xanthine dehydrogenase Mo-binding subunit